MKVLRDCFERDVRLTHILEHPEMVGFENAIASTLNSPDDVRISNSDNAVYLFYRHYQATSVGAKWLCVVAKYLDTDAFIITAYLTDKPKAGDIVWPRN
jgi:hypothetical protein